MPPSGKLWLVGLGDGLISRMIINPCIPGSWSRCGGSSSRSTTRDLSTKASGNS